MAGSMVRTFLAVDVTPEIRAALAELRDALARCGAAVRWVGAAQLHATVKFLGGVSDAVLPNVHSAVRDALAATAPMTAVVRGLGVFPDSRRPRIVWVGIDCPSLSGVAAALDDALEPLGFARESRPSHAHITLGRVTRPSGWAPLAAALRTRDAGRLGSCELVALSGYRSDLHRDGAVYTKLWTVPFGG